MSFQSSFARELTLASHFGDDANTAAGALATLHFGLIWSTGSEITSLAGGLWQEPDSTGGYARVAKPNDNTFITLDTFALLVNNTGNAITWPATTGIYNIQAPFDYWGIWDNSVGGNLRYWGRLTTPIVVTGAGDTPRIPAGQWIYRTLD